MTSLLPTAIKEGHSHRVLLAFNAATLHEFLRRSRDLDEGTLAYLLPAFLEPLKHGPQSGKDAIVRIFVPLGSTTSDYDLWK